MSAADNKAIVERARQRWNAQDLRGYLALYDPGAVLHGYPGVEPGFDSIRRFYEAFCEAFPGSQLSFEDVIAEGDRIAIRFTLNGTHQGEFQGIPATGRSVSAPFVTVFDVANGSITSHRPYWDLAGFMAQLSG